jgi:hypothetical protein
MSATMAAAQARDHTNAPAHVSIAQENALVQAVREATAGFRSATTVAGPGGGYELKFGCVSGGEFGAMGLHYVNMSLVGDGEVDVMQPEILLYEPSPNGGIRLTGADYLVYAADWDSKHAGAPQLNGQLFHLFESPNRFGLPAFYTLHVWAWKENPNGTFTNWNPNVSCDAFDARTPRSERGSRRAGHRRCPRAASPIDRKVRKEVGRCGITARQVRGDR